MGILVTSFTLGGSIMRNYFCGWYFRCQSNHQTLAIIPSIHKSRDADFCTIQIITDTEAFHAQFPYSDFRKGDNQIAIAGSQFGKEGIALDVRTQGLHATGAVQFRDITPIQYDIMGPFRYVPFMQCKHSVYSMRHLVDGELSINGTSYVFRDATGYIEGDRGYSFPREYVWTQFTFPAGALMLSIADIPLGMLHFTGVIGIVLLNGKEYRLATYLGAKAVRITATEIIIQQGEQCLILRPQGPSGHPLRAPLHGAMSRTIHEHPSCKVSCCFKDGDATLLDLEVQNAAFEYEY